MSQSISSAGVFRFNQVLWNTCRVLQNEVSRRDTRATLVDAHRFLGAAGLCPCCRGAGHAGPECRGLFIAVGRIHCGKSHGS